MLPTVRRSVVVVAVISVFLALYSCSGPVAPRPGSAGFAWLSAREAFAAGDYANTLAQLDNVLAKDDGEYAARALPWALVLNSGMAEGYMEIADAYEKGAKINKAQPDAFRRQMVLGRNAAGRLVLQFADKFETFNALALDPVPLAFALPKGSAGQAPQLLKASTGSMPTPPLVEAAQQETIQRNVILAACRAAGLANDPARTAQLLGAADPKVSRATFQLAMANTLFSMAQMFSRDKLDDSEKMGILCQRAQNALKKIPDSTDSKELTDRIQRAMKQLPKRS